MPARIFTWIDRIAIGTFAIAVALNAAAGLASHARLGNVKWPCALVFSAAGVAGALLGASLAQQLGGHELLTLFGLAMVGVGIAARRDAIANDVHLTSGTAAHLLPRLLGFGLGVGMLSGFFGIGGGFLIVPGLMFATGMALHSAIGTSLRRQLCLVSLVDWRLALLVIAGGITGSLLGARANAALAGHKRLLAIVFAGLVIAAGLYVTVSATAALLAAIN